MSDNDSFSPNSFMYLTVLLRTNLARYPSLTFDGIIPSANMKLKHRVWSATIYIASIGAVASFNTSGSKDNFSATFLRKSFKSEISSKSIIPAILAFSDRISVSSSTPLRSVSLSITGPNVASYAVGVP